MRQWCALSPGRRGLSLARFLQVEARSDGKERVLSRLVLGPPIDLLDRFLHRGDRTRGQRRSSSGTEQSANATSLPPASHNHTPGPRACLTSSKVSSRFGGGLPQACWPPCAVIPEDMPEVLRQSGRRTTGQGSGIPAAAQVASTLRVSGLPEPKGSSDLWS